MRKFHVAAVPEPCVYVAHSPTYSAEALGGPKNGPRNHSQQSREIQVTVYRET